ncbi:MAG: glycosyltransferase family 8 protein [Pseudonocardia sp.]|nr:glycosyltransferase family 8 protein [Pseudonocardia sp.]
MSPQIAGPLLAPIVCGVDERYLHPLGALMRSLAAAHPGDRHRLRLIVLHRGLSAAAQAKIGEEGGTLGLLAVETREIPDVARRRYPVSGWVSEAVYLRLAAAEALPDEQRALYLDVDTLVLRDLRPLLTLPLDGAPLAAVRDPQNPTVGMGLALPNCRRLGVPAGREYFNSGVMLLDLHACRRDGLFDRAHEFLAVYPGEVLLWDQDALNVATEDRWVRLPRRWNTFALSPLATEPEFVHYAEPVMPLAELLCDEYLAAVLHYAGPAKPWQDHYPAGPLRELYRRFLTTADLAVTR